MRKLIKTAIIAFSLVSTAHAGWLTPDAYDKKHAETVLKRSVYYTPGWGAVYKERWEEIVKNDPNTRAVAIHFHGCGGLGYFESKVAAYYINRGIAVITPDFVARPGNKTGCPGIYGDPRSMLNGGSQRYQAFTYSARNPDRLDARVDDLEAVLAYVKQVTGKPVIISGHSEGARTSYHFNRVDPQVAGIILHNQSCSPNFDHIFRLPTSYKTFQVIEDSDPWADGSRDCSHHFKGDDRNNLTLLRQSGTNHDPIANREVIEKMTDWINNLLGGSWKFKPAIEVESILPAIQKNFEIKNETSTSK